MCQKVTEAPNCGLRTLGSCCSDQTSEFTHAPEAIAMTISDRRHAKREQKYYHSVRRHRKSVAKPNHQDEVRQLVHIIPGLNNRPDVDEVTVIDETIKFITQLENALIRKHCPNDNGDVTFDRSRPQMHPLLRKLLPRNSPRTPRHLTQAGIPDTANDTTDASSCMTPDYQG
ncbi:unnamed protein product [Mesocestoides corti]|uniref:BHLH domain-containing protein n=2 Tax=Mesocestoides corti TaxID=53468 RepID=A0A0R3UGK8_MESCO|nr:unnamed protein product [Mesocestoides corti]